MIMSAISVEAQYDTVVVGARVAGASTAMLLARAGQRVLVIEKGAAGSDTTSTHALMRAGVMQLHRWGVLEPLIEAGTPAIRRTTFHYGDEAIEAGARVIHGATVRSVLQEEGRAAGVEFVDADGIVHRVHARVVIGAD